MTELEKTLQEKKQALLNAYKEETHRTPGQLFYYEAGLNAGINCITSGENTKEYLFALINKGRFGNFKDYDEYSRAYATFCEGFDAIYNTQTSS